MLLKKAYLGDAVYAALDELSRLTITTEDGIRATNTIVFEPETLLALMEYMCVTPELAAILNAHLRTCPEAKS